MDITDQITTRAFDAHVRGGQRQDGDDEDGAAQRHVLGENGTENRSLVTLAGVGIKR